MTSTAHVHLEPIRLLRQAGRWSIEYTRLVAVDEHLLRPERCRVAATSDAFRTREIGCGAARVDEALALMREADDGSPRVFELGADGWTPLGPARPTVPPRGQTDLAKQLAETRAQLVVLRGLYDALAARVITLESSNAVVKRSLAPSLGRRVPSRRSVFDGLKDEGDARQRSAPTERRYVDMGAPLTAAVPSFAPLPAPDPYFAESAPAPPIAVDRTLASPAAPLLALPSSTDVVSCLQMLAADVPITQYRADAPSDLADFYAAFLSDEAGERIAALLFNLRAGAELGGGILGVAAAEREQQATLGLTADSLDGLNEVANNLTGVLNRANPKRLVRVSPVERGAEAPAWLRSPHKKLAFSTRAGGTLFLLVL